MSVPIPPFAEERRADLVSLHAALLNLIIMLESLLEQQANSSLNLDYFRWMLADVRGKLWIVSWEIGALGIVEERLREVSIVEDGNICAVCIDELKIGDEASRVVGCSHVYHRECIARWALENHTCPMCMYDILE
ncbi:hypothetical protein GIB67_040076 [Kingdonia uniflora]|uniref:RING-type domain-containing protein n=1 Tax=Kingdonia uniflora TaxID=39325 RepID=A0A7J7MUT6_9MAGN|nr:hypothetical protein GIB67_040076 [Kingdonia uniflora]